jgi:hypothetical protein
MSSHCEEIITSLGIGSQFDKASNIKWDGQARATRPTITISVLDEVAAHGWQ